MNRDSRPALKREWIVKRCLLLLASLTIFGILLIILMIVKESIPAIREAGPVNLLGPTWDPGNGQYGMLIFLVGTIVTTIGGLIIGVPFSLATAVFLAEMAPPGIGGVVSRSLEMLSGIPSIVIGFLGLSMLVPWIGRVTSSTGDGILAASIILGIMIMPTITTIAKDAIEAVPVGYKQGSIGLGATRWQTIWRVVLPAAKPGIIVAIILGMGRALGEATAVALVIGPSTAWPKSLWTPTHTLGSKLLTEIGESSGTTRSALFAMALVLLLVSMGLIMAARMFASRKELAR